MVIVEKEIFACTSETLAWFDSSDEARRGFCSHCGSALFKEQKNGTKMLIAVGSPDDTTTWKNVKNVFTADAGTYYIMPEGDRE